MHTHLVFDLRQIAVKLTAEADQQAIVGKFEDSFDNILGAGRGVSALMPNGVSL